MTNVLQTPEPNRRHFHLPRWESEHMWRRGAKLDSPIYFFLVAFGVPLMSYFITDVNYKAVIAMTWFAITHAYWVLEIQEMIVPVLRSNIVREENAAAQIASMQFLKNWGAQGAIVIWAFFLIGYVMFYWPHADWQSNVRFAFESLFATRPVSYGLIEWLIIAHTFLVSRYLAHFFNLLFGILLKAFPRAERIEKPGTN